MPPITPEQRAALPPEFQTIRRRVIAHFEARLAPLEAELAAARTTPPNSSPPPRTPPHAKPVPPPPRSTKKRGGQPGHPKHQRPLLPTDPCQAVRALKPEAGRRCGERRSGSDAAPLRHPVGERPAIRPLVTADQRHRLPSAGCGTATCAVLPTGVPESQAGPQWVAVTALLMGCFRPSKRRVALFLETVWHQPGSPGGVVQWQNQATAALPPADEELKRALPGQSVVGGDETPTKQGSAKAWLWTFVASLFTAFAIRPRRANTTVTERLGEAVPGVGTCDRAKMYWCGGRLQGCWAHRKRDFRAWIDHPDRVVKRRGHDLMRPTRKRFACWSRCRDGTLSRAEVEQQMGPIRREVNGLRRRGSFRGTRGVAGSCREWWEHRECLGRFGDVAGVEPTNNARARAWRPAVIGRRLSFGTPSAGGSRFVETVWSVVETGRQRKRNAFAFVHQAVKASFERRPAPLLLTGL
jgi:transposase